MTAAAFTAWQIMHMNGYTETYDGYLKTLGLRGRTLETDDDVDSLINVCNEIRNLTKK